MSQLEPAPALCPMPNSPAPTYASHLHTLSQDQFIFSVGIGIGEGASRNAAGISQSCLFDEVSLLYLWVRVGLRFIGPRGKID